VLALTAVFDFAASCSSNAREVLPVLNPNSYDLFCFRLTTCVTVDFKIEFSSFVFSFQIQLYIFRLQTPNRDPTFIQCASFDSWPQKWIEKWYTYFHLLFLYLVPLIAIVVCYTGICIKSFSRAVKMDSRATVSQQNANIPENEEPANEEEFANRSPDQAASQASIKRVCISVDQDSKIDVIEMENLSNTTGVASTAGVAVTVPRPSLRSEKQCEVRRSILRQTFVIVLAFLICWTPYVVSAFLFQVDYKPFKSVNIQMQDFFHLFAVSNSAVNPFIYGKFVRSDQRST
jgi:hypothetical protein